MWLLDFAIRCLILTRNALNIIREIESFIHLCKHIANDTAIIILGNPGALRPGYDMVQVILVLIIFWQVMQVAVLHLQKISNLD